MITVSHRGWKDLADNPIQTVPDRYYGTPDEWYAELQTIQPRHCGWPDGAIINNKGRICRAYKLVGYTRCHGHVNKGIVRRQTPRVLIDGRYSQYLPKDLRDKFIEAREDDELLAIRDNVAVLEASMGQLLGDLERGGTRAIWKKLQETWAEFQEANKGQDADAATAALSKVNRLIRDGSSEAEKRREIVELTGQIVSAKRAEHGRLKDLHQMVSAERVLLMLNAYHIRVMELVTDESTRYALAERMSELVTASRETPVLPVQSPLEFVDAEPS